MAAPPACACVWIHVHHYINSDITIKPLSMDRLDTTRGLKWSQHPWVTFHFLPKGVGSKTKHLQGFVYMQHAVDSKSGPLPSHLHRNGLLDTHRILLIALGTYPLGSEGTGAWPCMDSTHTTVETNCSKGLSQMHPVMLSRQPQLAHSIQHTPCEFLEGYLWYWWYFTGLWTRCTNEASYLSII